MKFAICNEMFAEPTSAATFGLIREIGYEGVEIAPFTLVPEVKPFDVRQVSLETVKAVRERAEATGLEVVGLHWLLAKTSGFHLTSPDAAARRATTDYLSSLASCCAALGGRIMVLGSPAQRNLLPGVSYNQAEDYAADVLRGAMPACATAEVTIALEPLGPSEGDFLLTAKSAIQLAQRVDSPHCKLNLDVKAMSTELAPIPQVIAESAAWMVHLHANDPNLLGPGMGEIDFAPIMGQLKTIGYQGWISVEPFRYEPSAEGIARASLANLRCSLG